MGRDDWEGDMQTGSLDERKFLSDISTIAKSLQLIAERLKPEPAPEPQPWPEGARAVSTATGTRWVFHNGRWVADSLTKIEMKADER